MEQEDRPKTNFKEKLALRYVMAVLSSVGFAIIYGLKVNLSVAIVVMINHTKLDELSAHESETHTLGTEDTCVGIFEQEKVELEDGPFDWSEPMQGLVLGSYFWGYLVTQLPGGRIAEVFSARWVFFAAATSNALAALLTPVAADKGGVAATIVVRVIQGLGAGVTFPAMHVLIARWSPPEERSVFSSIIYAGTSLGTVISMFMSGWLAHVGGWTAVFYVMGGLSLLWCALWLFLITDTPAQSWYLSDREKIHIQTQLGISAIHSKEKTGVPWRAVFTSRPFYAIVVAHFCGNVGWYMMLIELPKYMQQILLYGIKENAMISALPFLAMWLYTMVLSNILDYFRKKEKITTTTARKIATFTCCMGPAISLIGVSLVGCNRPAAIAMMVIAVSTFGGMFCGYLSNHIDISPNYAGTLMALTNSVATIPGFLVPPVVGALLHNNETLGQWNIIFYGASALLAIGAFFYVLYASGEEQPWNKNAENTAEDDALEGFDKQENAAEDAALEDVTKQATNERNDETSKET